MTEYIEREELLKDINETVVFTVRNGVKLPTSEMRGANKVIDRIKSAPTADVVEVKHGEWIDSETNEGAVCSLCKSFFDSYYGFFADEQFKYCPNCGAKMDGKGD